LKPRSPAVVEMKLSEQRTFVLWWDGQDERHDFRLMAASADVVDAMRCGVVIPDR
jgi:hypothetical protein